MQQADRMVRPIHFVANEFQPFQAYRLGLRAFLHREPPHNPRCSCGGGRTVSKLAAIATQGKVYGVDYSEESVAATKRTNARWIDLGCAEIRHGSVSQLPFPDAMFDLVTAVETHFWWPNLSADMRELFRVLKPGGTLALIAEVYKGANTTVSRLAEKYASRTGMTLLSVDEHRELFTNAAFSNVQVIEERHKGWICAIGRKPIANP
jgi:ubiquinone/menaquinone biosynthesis C-methylase UbiE